MECSVSIYRVTLFSCLVVVIYTDSDGAQCRCVKVFIWLKVQTSSFGWMTNSLTSNYWTAHYNSARSHWCNDRPTDGPLARSVEALQHNLICCSFSGWLQYNATIVLQTFKWNGSKTNTVKLQFIYPHKTTNFSSTVFCKYAIAWLIGRNRGIEIITRADPI